MTPYSNFYEFCSLSSSPFKNQNLSSPRSIHLKKTQAIIFQSQYLCLQSTALGRQGRVKQARQMFDEMPHRDLVTYSTMTSLYIKNDDLPKVKCLFKQLPERNVVIDSVMSDGLLKAGQIKDAQKLFDSMPSRDVFTWTSLLSGYCRVGKIF